MAKYHAGPPGSLASQPVALDVVFANAALGMRLKLVSGIVIQGKDETTRLCLLVVDSISSLITPILGGRDSHGMSHGCLSGESFSSSLC